MVTDIDSLFQAFGGPTKVGEAIGVSRGHAANMRARGSIPSEYWESLVADAARREIPGVTLEALAKIASTRRKPASEQKDAAA